MPEFYIIIARKIFSRILGGHVPHHPCLPHPPRLLRLRDRNPTRPPPGDIAICHVCWSVCSSVGVCVCIYLCSLTYFETEYLEYG